MSLLSPEVERTKGRRSNSNSFVILLPLISSVSRSYDLVFTLKSISIGTEGGHIGPPNSEMISSQLS